MGQNYENIKNIQKKLFSESKENLNESFVLNIINTIDIKSKNYLGLSITIGYIKCNQFIILKKEFNENIIKTIKVRLKDIKLKMIYNKNYLEIKNYSIIYSDSIINPDQLEEYIFELPEITDNIDKIKKKKNISIKLKAKEFESISSYSYQFSDIFSKIINLQDELLNNFENDKIYLFNGFNYYKDSLKPINISSIEIIDKDSEIENYIISENIQNIQTDKIVNIQGNIKNILLNKCSLIIEELNTKNKFEIKLNHNLIKKINPNNKCTFINFQKKENFFIYTNISDIYSNEETIIEIYFYDFPEQYYNRIKISNDYYINIDKNKIQFNIDSIDKSEIFEQKFIYEKINGGIENSYEFILEVNKGKVNRFCSFLKEKGKHTYQIYFQSKNEKYLPENLNIKDNEDRNIQLDIFDNYENNLIKRLTIINTIGQDFFEKEKIKNDKNNTEINNAKINILLKNNYEKSILHKNSETIKNNINNNSKYIFEFNKENINKKEHFLLVKKEQENISIIFNSIFNEGKGNEIIMDSNLINDINLVFSNEILIKNCQNGFKNYIFENNKVDYQNIKRIILLYIYYKFNKNFILLDLYIELIRNLLPKLATADYFEKIQILLFLLDKINKENNKISFDIIDIYNEKIGEYDNIKYYKPIIGAFKLFFNIMDDQNEQSSIYHTILQFQGSIKTDLITNKKVYSGVLKSLNDIKFELIKGINRFCIVDMSIKNSLNNDSEILEFYLDPLTQIREEKLQIYFLLDVFKGVFNYSKKIINNTELESIYYLNYDFNLVEINYKNSSENIFKNILINNYKKLKILLKDENIDNSPEPKNNVQNDSNDFNVTTKESINDNNLIQTFKDDKNIFKSLSCLQIKELIEVRNNPDEFNFYELNPSFKIPDNMTKEEFNKILKNSEIYQKFLK